MEVVFYNWHLPGFANLCCGQCVAIVGVDFSVSDWSSSQQAPDAGSTFMGPFTSGSLDGQMRSDTGVSPTRLTEGVPTAVTPRVVAGTEMPALKEATLSNPTGS